MHQPFQPGLPAPDRHLQRVQLVEQGTHTELLALGGLYVELYQRQFQGQEPAVAWLSP